MIVTPARLVWGLLATLLLPGLLWGMDPRFELDLRSLATAPPSRSGSGSVSSPAEPRTVVKSVQSGKSRRAATSKRTRKAHSRKADDRTAAAEARHGLQLLGTARSGEAEGFAMLERIWEELLPSKEESPQEVDVETGQFVLSLDPDRYPLLAAADGGKILVDKYRSMPPLVKSLLTQNEPDIRIVSENPQGAGFIRAMLNAAGFYSLEQDMDIGFGDDPKLTVHADYKIEKDAESLLRHDVILLNVGRYHTAMPESLVDFLKNEGFRVVEPTLPKNGVKVAGFGEIHQILAREPAGIADSLMNALAIRFDSDRNLDMAGFSDHGITLKIRADRYFENRGKQFVVSFFDGDPVSYTLVRLMETSGYRVIILDDRDDLKSVAEKFSSRLQLGGQYAVHKLWDSRNLPYNVEMSGMMMVDANQQKRIVVTNRIMEPLTRELAELNGYTLLRY